MSLLLFALLYIGIRQLALPSFLKAGKPFPLSNFDGSVVKKIASGFTGSSIKQMVCTNIYGILALAAIKSGPYSNLM